MFSRRDDGTWCRRDKSGRLYPVNAQRERVAKPRGRNVDDRHPENTRPPSISPHVWRKVLTAVQRTQWWKEHGEKEVGLPATLDPQWYDDVNQDEDIDVRDKLERELDMYDDSSKIPDS